ncbi:MAG: mechanosensitive ion channel family protein [Steroidobacteraceae bacterium]
MSHLVPSRRPALRWTCLLFAAAVVAGVAEPADAPKPATADASADRNISLTADDVRHHMGHVIDWYHRLSGLTPSAELTDDVVTRDRLRQTMLTEVRTAFRFGRAAAPLVREAAPEAADAQGTGGDPDATDSASYARLNTGMDDRARQLTTQIAKLDAELRSAPAARRAVLAAQRAQLAAALALTQEVQQTVSGLQQFAANSNSKASGEKGLLADIADMERTVPEARLSASGVARTSTTNGSDPATQSAAASVTTTSTPDTSDAAPRTEEGGLITLTKEWLALRDAMKQHAYYIKATEELSDALDKISSTLTAQVRELLSQVPAAATATDTKQLASVKTAIDTATLRFRDLSTLLVPLGQESITLDNARSILWGRHDALEQRSNAVLNAGLTRLAVVGASILLILLLSTLWRRATFRYLHDSRRRQQFLSLRRIVTALALLIVVVFAFLSEIGSLATYIGFVTAGIAVALQNVILAVVAYFFLIGRYGVRVGDRITLAGVTGRVAEIGLIRLYLAELGGTELHPTGRMIVLSNAVIFQPSALFKQIPGIDYTWHTATLVLDPAADPQQARTRLQNAANAVYEHYRAAIEHSLRGARDRIDFESATPTPEVTARFSEAGLEIAVRYPVMPEDSAQVDQQMNRALHEELDNAPKLAVVKPAH